MHSVPHRARSAADALAASWAGQAPLLFAKTPGKKGLASRVLIHPNTQRVESLHWAADDPSEEKSQLEDEKSVLYCLH